MYSLKEFPEVSRRDEIFSRLERVASYANLTEEERIDYEGDLRWMSEYEEEIATVLENAQLAYTLALDRYKQGLDAFINVSDAQISVLEYANELVIARGNVLTALVTLQKSLAL